MGEWCTIESEPSVITELIQKMGTTDAMCEELYDLSDEGMSQLGETYGLIFLFKWQKGETDYGNPDTPGVFFAQQVIQNACATQAVLSILLNADSRLEIGDELTKFKEFAADFDPEMKGLSISNSETIRTVHNSFAQQTGYIVSQDNKQQGEAFHFISYVPINERLYELDGLKRGPVDLGPCTTSNWLAVARPALQARIQKYQSSEIRFNLMAVIKDRRKTYRQEIAQLTGHLATLSNEGAGNTRVYTEDRIKELERLIQGEDRKLDEWKATNARRKYNYTPFIMNLFKILAKDGRLQQLVDESKEKATNKRRRVDQW